VTGAIIPLETKGLLVGLIHEIFDEPPPHHPPLLLETTGRVGTTMLIVRISGVAILPIASAFRYVRTYTPGIAVLTVHEAMRTPVPSILSIHTAPASTYTVHCVRVIVADPIRVMTGAIVSM
jgi:succinate dehydrogenase hydrophobic anchor subunit